MSIPKSKERVAAMERGIPSFRFQPRDSREKVSATGLEDHVFSLFFVAVYQYGSNQGLRCKILHLGPTIKAGLSS